MKIGNYAQTWTKRFLCFYKGKCPTKSVQINEGIIEPIQGKKKGLGHAKSLWYLKNFMVVAQFLWIIFSHAFSFFLFSFHTIWTEVKL